VLARAVESVALQRLPADCRVEVIVVDDASPISALDELAEFRLEGPVTVRSVARPNGGPGAARNTGLGLVGRDVHAVALLDSDDVWAPQHLANALAALEAGADLYFSNHARPSVYDSYFASIGLTGRKIGAPLAGRGSLYQLTEERLGAFLKHYLAQTSTLVYRWARHRQARFPTELSSAGEDHVFLLGLALASSRILFSDELEVCCGDGVNIYFGNLSWDAPGCLRRISDRLSSFRLIERFVESNAAHDVEAKRFVAAKIASLQRMVALLSARGLVKRISGFGGEIRTVARRDPRFWSWYPRRLAEVGLLMMTGRFTPADE
jgi:succinoglycan biosynthesis protein ExoW